MLRTDLRLLFVPLFCALELMGCKPEIGDECTVSTDCSAAGERLCDTTQPGGYCTIFNCEPGTCPEEAICVSYGNSRSNAPGCRDRNGRSRYEETYCVAKCEDDDDCRSGYACIDMGRENPGGVVIVENGSVDGRVCVVPYSGLPIPEDRSTAVCTGATGPFKEPDGGPDAGPEAGADAGADSPGDAETDAGADADAAGDGATE
jgi:hypothetical protein